MWLKISMPTVLHDKLGVWTLINLNQPNSWKI